MHDFLTNSREEAGAGRSVIGAYGPALVFELRELTPDDVAEGEAKLAKAKEPPMVIERFEQGLFDTFLIESGSKIYEVATLGFWAKCTCLDFPFSGSACKHVVLCLPRVCLKCREKEVTVHGDICGLCSGTKYELYDQFQVKKVYKPTQVFVVLRVDDDGTIGVMDRRDYEWYLRQGKQPPVWELLDLGPKTMGIYAEQDLIEQKGKFESEFFTQKENNHVRTASSNGSNGAGAASAEHAARSV